MMGNKKIQRGTRVIHFVQIFHCKRYDVTEHSRDPMNIR